MKKKAAGINIEVKESGIHGKGLFATKKIKAGEIIGFVVGEKTDKDGPHVLWVDEDTSIKVTGDLRYINHSKTPNACYCDDLSVIAVGDIKRNQEITHDYGEDWS